MSLDENTWIFWLGLKSWTHDEATLILFGEIPSDHNVNELMESGWVNSYEYDPIKLMVRKEFKSKADISPIECLNWAITSGIDLNKSLVMEFDKYKSKSESKIIVSNTESGKHHLQKKIDMLCLALHLINDPKVDFPKEKLFKKDKNGESIHIEVLADACAKYLNLVWSSKSKKNAYQVDTIIKILSGAVNLKHASKNKEARK